MSGLYSQLGVAEEATVGTALAPTRFLEFTSESMSWTPNAFTGAGLRAGGLYQRSSRYTRTTFTAGGEAAFEFMDRGFGLLLKHMLGGTPVVTVVGGTAARLMTVRPGDTRGLGLSVQKGVQEISAGFPMTPLTYGGCKVTGWTLSIEQSNVLMLNLTLDGWNEVTSVSLGTATYPADSALFPFSGSSITIGGTPTTTSNVTTVAGGTALNRIRSFGVTQQASMATERFFLGGAGSKAEQIENGWRGLTVALDAEWNRTQLYDWFKSGAPQTVVFSTIGRNIAAGVNARVDIILPACLPSEAASPAIGGPDLISHSPTLLVLDDAVNGPIQINYTTLDTAA